MPLLYLKPVQTGFPADSDSRLVAAAARGVLEHGPHAAALLPPEQRSAESGGLDSAGQPEWWLTMRTLYAWGQPVSPHLAVQREGAWGGDTLVTCTGGPWHGRGRRGVLEGLRGVEGASLLPPLCCVAAVGCAAAVVGLGCALMSVWPQQASSFPSAARP